MKKYLFSLFSLMVIGLFQSGIVWAQEACGGVIQYSNDCAGNDRKWHISCCPDNYRVQGVAYTDIKNKDAVDAISTICRKGGASENPWMPTGDFQRPAKKFECNKEEVMAGIYSKDRMADDGKSDTLDGLTAFCQKPGSNALRKVYNADIEGGREGREQTVLLPKRVVGIASKEKEKGESDEKDCVTIVTKD